MPRYASLEDEWRAYIDGTHHHIVWGRRLFRYIPYAPRCIVCFAPFGGPGGLAFRVVGIRRWDKNPNVCTACIKALVKHELRARKPRSRSCSPTSGARARSHGRWRRSRSRG